MRYFFAFLVTILLLITLIFALFNRTSTPKSPTTTPKTLSSYANTDSQASLTIDGPINAASEHDQVKIMVNNDIVTFQILRGYDGNATKTQRFANSVNAYSAFLSALNNAGFTKWTADPAYGDGSGTCPLGDRYSIVFTAGGKKLENSWASTCVKPRTYLGNLPMTLTLFEYQVPDYGLLTNELNL